MNTPQQLHPEDGELVRFLDHELHHGECKSLMSHLSRCEVCAERMRAFSELSQGLGDLLPFADPSAEEVARVRLRVTQALEQASARPVRRRWAPPAAVLRIAAAAVLVFGVTLGVQPVRAWVMEQLGLAPHGGVATAPQASDAAMAISQPQTTVSFSPMDDVFRFIIDRPQDEGTLTLSLADAERASIHIVGMVKDVAMLPGGVHIANEPGTTAGYSVVLPPQIKQVEVILAGSTVERFDVESAELPWERVISLKR